MNSTVSASPSRSPAGGPVQKASGVSQGSRKMIWLIAAILCMFFVFFSGPFTGLSVDGQRVLGILAFAVIVWISEAISYPLSAVAIFTFLTVGLGFAPAGPGGARLGTGKALTIALGGLTNGGWVLVVTGLFIAAIMLETGLEKRMALTILKIVGTKTKNLMAGMIVAMSVFGFFIPSVTARSATLCPIALGLVDALKFSVRQVNFAANFDRVGNRRVSRGFEFARQRRLLFGYAVTLLALFLSLSYLIWDRFMRNRPKP